VKKADGEVRTDDPAFITPSVRRIPSACAPKVVTLTLSWAWEMGAKASHRKAARRRDRPEKWPENDCERR
jgi:hypothetical protein